MAKSKGCWLVPGIKCQSILSCYSLCSHQLIIQAPASNTFQGEYRASMAFRILSMAHILRSFMSRCSENRQRPQWDHSIPFYCAEARLVSPTDQSKNLSQWYSWNPVRTHKERAQQWLFWRRPPKHLWSLKTPSHINGPVLSSPWTETTCFFYGTVYREVLSPINMQENTPSCPSFPSILQLSSICSIVV